LKGLEVSMNLLQVDMKKSMKKVCLKEPSMVSCFQKRKQTA